MNLKDIILELHSLEGIKFGSFQLKNGITSPVYFDLRVIISRPELLKEVSNLFSKELEKVYKPDLVCGVPYTALPFATLVSVDNAIPMIMRRKELKNYGTKKVLEGNFNEGQNCLILEDVITSGSSVLETTEVLQKQGLKVKDVFVFLDREQGGKTNLENNGLKVRSIVKVTELLAILFDNGKIDEATKNGVLEFIRKSQLGSEKILNGPIEVTKMSLKDRMCSTNSLAIKRLFKIMIDKQTNLCLAADVLKFDELISIANKLGPKICLLKTHVDILLDWDKNKINELKEAAKKHNFLLFEDRKFADIGNTVQAQINEGLYSISAWADFVTVHGLPGPGLLQALTSTNCKALVVAQMSSKGNLIDENYTQKCVDLVRNNDVAVGVISQSRLDNIQPDFIHMTPGVKLSSQGDSLGQTYNSPKTAILDKGADVIIVGRGITGCSNPVEEAEKYRAMSWQNLTDRISSI